MSSSNNPSSSITNEGQKGETYYQQAPYTSEEKAWVKKHFRDEFHFLQLYGLKIFNDEDREEGRAIARVFIEADKEDGRKS